MKTLSRLFLIILAFTLILSPLNGALLAEEAPKHIENLIVGTLYTNNNFNVNGKLDAFGRMNYHGFTQGNLVYRDADGNLQPYFFRTFEVSEDGTVLDFTWHKGAMWHDGQPVTDEDIIFSFEFMRDTKKIGSLIHLESIEVTGENAARLTFTEPDVYYWLNTTCLNTRVFAKHIWEGVEDYANYTGDDAAIGCGPYKLTSYDLDSQTSYYEAVPENAFLGEITVDKVTVQTYADQATLMMAMVNGECDAYYNYASPIDATLIESFIGIDGLDIGQSDFSGSYQMLFGCSRSPGDDIDFRQAIAYAIDYPTVATAICGKYGRIANRGILNPAIRGFDETIGMLEYNAEKAKAMLDEAGYVDSDGDGWREFKDGTVMDLTVIPQYSSKMEVRMRIGEIVCTSLKNIGVNCHIDEEAIVNGEIWEDRVTKEEYDISITFCTSGVATYSTPFRYLLAELREGEKGWHWGSYHNPILTKAFYNMTEAINDKQYLENSLILQRLADDEMFALTLAWQTSFFPYRTDRYDGWDNWASWGAVHAEIWFELTAK
ncbi:MAG: ABC transporter substrate-binding protein [Christensenellales bacterium]